MNTLSASLCKKPILGVAMWLMSLCVTNQAFHEKYVDLGVPGVLLSETFEAPMKERYSLIFLLPQATNGSKVQTWSNIVCPAESTEAPAISISAKVTALETGNTAAFNFPVVCPRSQHENSKSLAIGSMQLEAGKYRIELVNSSALLPLKGKPVQALLRGEGAGFP